MVLSHQSRTKSMRTHLSLNVFFFFESFKIKIVIYVYTSYYTIKYDVSLYTDFICIKKLDLNNFTLYLYCFFYFLWSAVGRLVAPSLRRHRRRLGSDRDLSVLQRINRERGRYGGGGRGSRGGHQ